MKILTILCAIALSHTIIAMDTTPHQITKLKGIVARNENGGYLECIVQHNATTNSYSGEIFNKGYEISEWFSQGLTPEEAKEHYIRILDEKKTKKN
jgi:hypothetical protein